MRQIQVIGIEGIPLIDTGDDLAGIIMDAALAQGAALRDGDVVVVTSKIVSKAEGRWVDIETIIPDAEAVRVAETCDKDPREVSLILSESTRISRVRKGVLIVRHRHGFVCANAGMDHSNTRPGESWRLLLPENPDRSARQIRSAIHERLGVKVGVILSDSHGRPFRMGTVGVAVGAAGLPALWDLRGRPDLFGTKLRVTEVGFADELAAAAGLVLGQAAECIPVVIIRGVDYPIDEESSAEKLVRPAELDLYQ